jgi:hypothetical protein
MCVVAHQPRVHDKEALLSLSNSTSQEQRASGDRRRSGRRSLDRTTPALEQRARRAASPRPASAASTLEAALCEVLRVVVREEARSALADHRAEEREREATKLVPLAEAAVRLGLSPKALRSRCERGSVSGAKRIGGRWHMPLRAVEP